MECLELDLFDDPAIEEDKNQLVAGRDTGTATETSCVGGGSEAEGESESSDGVTVWVAAAVDCDEGTAIAGGGIERQ